MKKGKKYLSALAILVTLVPTGIYARSFPTQSISESSPIWDYINQMNSSLEISSRGIATATGYIRTMTGETVKLTVQIQQYKNGSWTTLHSWSNEDLYSCTIQKERAVTQGYSYRVETTGRVYDANGKLLESETVHSQTEYY